MCACLRPIVQITQAVDRILIIVQWRLKSINMCNFREAAETEFSFKQNGPTKISYDGGCKEKKFQVGLILTFEVCIHCNHLSIF